MNYLTIHGSTRNRSNAQRRMLFVQVLDPADRATENTHTSHAQGMVLAGLAPVVAATDSPAGLTATGVLANPMYLSNVLQRLGLRVINSLARSVPAVRERVAYGDHQRHHLDWYRHRDDATRPTVVFFYGGNWRSGRRQDYRFVADTLMTLGCDAVVPDYRLYPHVRFADILRDAQQALEVVLARLPDDRPLVIMGHSAGAQIGALLTLNANLLSDNGRIAGFVGLAGPYDFYPFTDDDHWELFGPEDAYPASQPVNFVRGDAAPLYLLHGRDDTRVRRGHSKSLMEKQGAAGGIAHREVYDNVGHVDIIVSFSRLHRQRRSVVSDVGAFIARLAAGEG